MIKDDNFSKFSKANGLRQLNYAKTVEFMSCSMEDQQVN